MAHHFKVEARPHKNKDGSISKKKKDYVIFDQTRRGTVELTTVHSEKAIRPAIDEARTQIIKAHLKKHPADRAFQRKYGLI